MMNSLTKLILNFRILLLTDYKVDDIVTGKTDNPVLSGLDNALTGFLNESITITTKVGIGVFVLSGLFLFLSILMFRRKRDEAKESAGLYAICIIGFFSVTTLVGLFMTIGGGLFKEQTTNVTGMIYHPIFMQIKNLFR